MLQRVLNACQRTAGFVRDRSEHKIDVCLVVPAGDPIVSGNHGCDIVVGPEHDVLARYAKLMDHYKPDYLVRITSDCPEIPSPLISKLIFTSVNHSLDYMSNVMSQCRTYPDGFDCEVIGKDLFKWLDETCRDPYEREHVTVRLQADRPHWARVGHCLSYCDNSHLKISVDTEEDLNFVRMYAELMQSKINFAKNNGEVTIRW